GLDGDALAAVLDNDRRRFLGRFQIAVDGQHLRAVAREEERRRPAVAQAFARPLPGTDDDGDLLCKPHGLLQVFARSPSSRNRRLRLYRCGFAQSVSILGRGLPCINSLTPVDARYGNRALSQVAGNEVAGLYLPQGGSLRAAAHLGIGAAGVEMATGR